MMGRSTSPALDAKLAGPITAVGYLLRLETEAVRQQARSPQTLQLCDIGTIESLTLGVFSAAGFKVSDAGTNEPTLKIQNTDGAIGSFLLNAQVLAGTRVTLWQVARDLPEEPILLGIYLPRGTEIGIGEATIKLARQFTVYRFAPSRRINSSNGLRFALRPGEFLLWGSQRIFITDNRR